MTLARKLVARAASTAGAAIGDIVTRETGLSMFHDSSRPLRLTPMPKKLGARNFDRHRIVLVIDHYLPEEDDGARRIVKFACDRAREQHPPHVHDGTGASDVVLPRQGHLRAGMFGVGGDSRSPTDGAFGAGPSTQSKKRRAWLRQ